VPILEAIGDSVIKIRITITCMGQ